MGFIRIKLIEATAGSEVWKGLEAEGKTWDPFCGIHIKEAVEVPGQGIQLVQKKKTIYPDWNRCFDTHLHQGMLSHLIAITCLGCSHTLHSIFEIIKLTP